MASAEELVAVVERYAATVSGGDVEAIAKLFSEDAVQRDPMSEPARVGRPAIREFFASALASGDGMAFRASDVHPSGDHVGFHFHIDVRLEAGTMVIDGIETFHVDDDGRITESRAYWDPTSVTVA